MDPTLDEAARDERRSARATWPGRLLRDGTHPAVDSARLTAEERMGAVWAVTLSAWLIAGRTLPRIPRSQWPGEIRRAP